MGQPEVGLDLNLPPELMLHPLFLNLGLEQNLQRHNGFQLALAGQVDIPKLAFTQWPTNVEVLNRKLSEIRKLTAVVNSCSSWSK